MNPGRAGTRGVNLGPAGAIIIPMRQVTARVAPHLSRADTPASGKFSTQTHKAMRELTTFARADHIHHRDCRPHRLGGDPCFGVDSRKVIGRRIHTPRVWERRLCR